MNLNFFLQQEEENWEHPQLQLAGGGEGPSQGCGVSIVPWGAQGTCRDAQDARDNSPRSAQQFARFI